MERRAGTAPTGIFAKVRKFSDQADRNHRELARPSAAPMYLCTEVLTGCGSDPPALRLHAAPARPQSMSQLGSRFGWIPDGKIYPVSGPWRLTCGCRNPSFQTTQVVRIVSELSDHITASRPLLPRSPPGSQASPPRPGRDHDRTRAADAVRRGDALDFLESQSGNARPTENDDMMNCGRMPRFAVEV